MNHAPFITFWEVTRACDLACRHCRASACPSRDPDELDGATARRLLMAVAAAGTRVMVLTGGDPAKRPDLADLVEHGTSLGLRMALTPSATPLVTRALLARLRDAGLARLAISVDGATAAVHDAFRGVPGSFRRTLEILADARAIGLTTQINTTVTPDDLPQLEAIAALAGRTGVELWSVFFLVPVGRAIALEQLGPAQVEDALHRLADVAEQVPFDVKTTCAPHFRRILRQRKVRRRVVGLHDGIGRAAAAVNDGCGIAFVSHRGEVHPSGFLPIPCGHAADLTRIYREHPTFVRLRDSTVLGGKCGICEFRAVCGGSRARAYAVYGDFMAEDPACAYQPGRRP